MANRTNTKKEPSMPPAEMERMGSTIDSWVEIVETGGECVLEGCPNDAPYVLLRDGRVRVPLPCPGHTPEPVSPEEELAVELSIGALASSGLTDRMRAFTFETYHAAFPEPADRAALAFVEEWRDGYMAGVRRNLLVWGEVGCGKSGLAAALVRDLCLHGVRARYVDFAALLDAIRDCISHKQPTTRALSVGDRSVLVLDDLGSEKTTEWSSAELLAIVNERYEAGLPTVYISNYAPKALEEKLGKFDPIVGKRIVTRIVEGAAKMEHAGKNKRLRQAA